KTAPCNHALDRRRSGGTSIERPPEEWSPPLRRAENKRMRTAERRDPWISPLVDANRKEVTLSVLGALWVHQRDAEPDRFRLDHDRQLTAGGGSTRFFDMT